MVGRFGWTSIVVSFSGTPRWSRRSSDRALGQRSPRRGRPVRGPSASGTGLPTRNASRHASRARSSARSRACRRSSVGGRSMSMTSRDPARPRAHDDHARRQEDRLRDRVGDEARSCVPVRSPDPQDLLVHPLAGHLVERAERLVHEQDRGLERERPGDRDALLHAARQLPRMVLGEVATARRARASPLADRARRPASKPMRSRAAARRCPATRPPIEQDRRLEDHPVVAVARRLRRRLAVDRDLAWRLARRGRR